MCMQKKTHEIKLEDKRKQNSKRDTRHFKDNDYDVVKVTKIIRKKYVATKESENKKKTKVDQYN